MGVTDERYVSLVDNLVCCVECGDPFLAPVEGTCAADRELCDVCREDAA